MSHNATNWAIQQRGLKPATKIVLWQLADRHNPDNGCFPSQELLAVSCEMSRSSLNDHLAILERRGLIRREQRVDNKTGKQQSTRYILACEEDFEVSIETQDVVSPCPDFGHGPVSEKPENPCPENDDSRVRNSDTNLVREPVIEPSSASVRAREDRFNILRERWVQNSLPTDVSYPKSLFDALPSEADRDDAIAYAADYQRRQVQKRSKPKIITYLRDKAWREFIGAPPIDKDGDFVITPDREEWEPWLENIRASHGEKGVESTNRMKRIVRATRWPPGHEPQQLEMKVA